MKHFNKYTIVHSHIFWSHRICSLLAIRWYLPRMKISSKSRPCHMLHPSPQSIPWRSCNESLPNLLWWSFRISLSSISPQQSYRMRDPSWTTTNTMGSLVRHASNIIALMFPAPFLWFAGHVPHERIHTFCYTWHATARETRWCKSCLNASW